MPTPTRYLCSCCGQSCYNCHTPHPDGTPRRAPFVHFLGAAVVEGRTFLDGDGPAVTLYTRQAADMRVPGAGQSVACEACYALLFGLALVPYEADAFVDANGDAVADAVQPPDGLTREQLEQWRQRRPLLAILVGRGELTPAEAAGVSFLPPEVTVRQVMDDLAAGVRPAPLVIPPPPPAPAPPAPSAPDDVPGWVAPARLAERPMALGG